MGGVGSGTWHRWNAATTFEETRRIDIRYLRKHQMLTPGYAYRLNWNVGGEPSGDIRYRCYSTNLVLVYRYREYGGEWESVEQPVYFSTSPCNYGGERKWFLCPSCNRRVAVLTLHGAYAGCRHCYELPYASQRKGYVDRVIQQKHKLGERIFEDYDGFGWTKKKGMHWKTFDRLFARYSALDQRIDDAILARFSGVL